MNVGILALVLLVGLPTAACVSRPAAPAPVDHEHRHTASVVLRGGAPRFDDVVRVSRYASVVWQNDTPDAVVVEVVGGVCNGCETVLGFVPSERGARTAPVPCGGMVSLCFHEAGRFEYSVRPQNGAFPSRGVVVVEDRGTRQP
jgi:hypothetical protein